MTQLDSILEQLVQDGSWRPEWQEVVARAGVARGGRVFRGVARRGRVFRKKRLIVALAVAAAVLIPLTAVASVNDWWFFRLPDAETPTSAPVVVKTGVWDGHPWQLVAFPSTTDGLCVSMVPGSSPSASSFGAAMGCGPFAGVSRTVQSKASPDMSITFLSGSPGKVLPGYILGPVIEQATTVEIKFGDGTTIRTPTFAGPPPLEHVRFYAVQLHGAALVPTLRAPTRGEPLEWVAGLDGRGRVVACLDPATATDGISPLSACR